MAYNYIRYSLGKHVLQLNALVLRKKHLINAGYSFANWSFIVAWGYVICYIFKTSKKKPFTLISWCTFWKMAYSKIGWLFLCFKYRIRNRVSTISFLSDFVFYLNKIINCILLLLFLFLWHRSIFNVQSTDLKKLGKNTF